MYSFQRQVLTSHNLFGVVVRLAALFVCSFCLDLRPGDGVVFGLIRCRRPASIRFCLEFLKFAHQAYLCLPSDFFGVFDFGHYYHL